MMLQHVKHVVSVQRRPVYRGVAAADRSTSLPTQQPQSPTCDKRTQHTITCVSVSFTCLFLLAIV